MGYDLAERVVLITGASAGIGRACAAEFHSAGARVAAAARSAEALEALADELGRDRVLPVAMDVTDAGQRADGLRVVNERFGPIDVLVNNAGWASFSSVLRTPPEHLERMVRLNFTSAVAMIQAVLPAMLERGRGQIVNVSSVVGIQAIPRMSAYSATKAAIASLSTGLRMELKGTGVDVILVSPGSTNTGFFAAAGSVDVKAVRLAQHQYSPQRVARALVRACRRRQREVTLTLNGKLICAVRRASHRLADAIILQVAKRSMPVAEVPGGGG